MFYVCLTNVQLIKPDRHMSELGRISRKNITSTLQHLLVLLCELYGIHTHTQTHTHTVYCHRTVLYRVSYIMTWQTMTALLNRIKSWFVLSNSVRATVHYETTMMMT